MSSAKTRNKPPAPVFAALGSGPRLELVSRMVDLRAQPPFTALVREGCDDLLFEIVEHSRDQDGDYAAYREIIVMQLEALKKNDDLERAQKDPEFTPIYDLGTDFTWHENYGYGAAIAEPECFIDLAELLVSWGFDDVNYLHPETKHSPLSAAVKRGHHPGIATYFQRLLDKGADLRDSDLDEVNPFSNCERKRLS